MLKPIYIKIIVKFHGEVFKLKFLRINSIIRLTDTNFIIISCISQCEKCYFKIRKFTEFNKIKLCYGYPPIKKSNHVQLQIDQKRLTNIHGINRVSQNCLNLYENSLRHKNKTRNNIK